MPEGKRCGFKSSEWFSSVGLPECGALQIRVETQHGPECIDFRDLKEDQNPCPPKQKLTNGKSGGLQCAFSDDVSVGIVPEIPGQCGGKGEMLVQALTGFFCRRVDEAAIELPVCPDEEIFVKTYLGFECIDFRDLKEDQNPCPPKQKLTNGKSGGLQCAFSDDDSVGIVPEIPGQCGGKGEMLVQALTGFFCRRVDEAAIELPVCPDEEIFVKTYLGFECIGKDVATLVCVDGFLLQRDIHGFQCIRKDDGDPALPTPAMLASGQMSGQVCRPGEVLLTEGHVHSCRRLDHTTDLCGAGFKPKPTAHDGSFICAPERKKILECPAGYSRSTSGTECLPVAPHADLCADPQFQALFGSQVNCSSGNLSAILVPCEEGYSLDTASDADTTDYVDVVCEENKSCRTEPHRKCDLTGTGTDSPCQALLRRVLTGCQPQCANGGSCHGDTCVCPPGLTGTACEEDVNECAMKGNDTECQHDCVNTFGSFHCACPFGYTLNLDQRSCKAIDCIPDCLNGGVCENGQCRCPMGLHGERCQNDFDECLTESHSCHGYCRNSFGSYRCVCGRGLKLGVDGRSCDPRNFDECLTGSHGCQGYCRNTFGSYRCVCGRGLRLGVDGRSCEPRDDTCPVDCRNGGRCQNHQCACPPGFYGKACQLDVNECLGGTHGCSNKCENTRGGYKCLCPPGMALLPDGRTCRKIIRS
ncbi:hypothetical protein EGW08_021332 [Elysia chlorotica]|uniref:EGF-like domain-containing protein n=1 Tax=Elysia chlorotica TaxID=188477 RepID=A0A3S1H2H8_ELYCH|nr:hypothetical protein EGW08_021332 [Elysia chlorotica]